MNYTTSKDYEKLWNLVQEGKKIPCLYQDDGIQRAGIAQKVCGEPAPPDGAFCGVGLVDSTKDIFIMYCTKMQVEILLPDEWIKIEKTEDVPQAERLLFYNCQDKTVMEGILSYSCVYSAEPAISIKAFSHYKPLPEPPRE